MGSPLPTLLQLFPVRQVEALLLYTNGFEHQCSCSSHQPIELSVAMGIHWIDFATEIETNVSDELFPLQELIFVLRKHRAPPLTF
jgi:hypothetical protein